VKLPFDELVSRSSLRQVLVMLYGERRRFVERSWKPVYRALAPSQPERPGDVSRPVWTEPLPTHPCGALSLAQGRP
jgi:hypothetical protein